MPTAFFAALPSQKAGLSVDNPTTGYPGFSPNEHRLLKAKTSYNRGSLPLPCDILWEKDVACPLRDKTVVYLNIFYPAPVEDKPDVRFPTIIAWGPFGKHGGHHWSERFGFGNEVSKSKLSGLQTWHGPDPAFWVSNGYAVVNVDPRGVFKSEGRMAILGTQEGQDGYDVVEWVAKQPWSNGSVGLSGTDWLASVQWYIAAERPPSLKAIAPWEGHADWYTAYLNSGMRDDGPIQYHSNLLEVVCANEVEGIHEMLKKEPFRQPAATSPTWGFWTTQSSKQSYWEDKKAKVENITTPAYVVSSWSNRIHATGTINAFSNLPSSTPSWLRIHSTVNTLDYYKNQPDLLSFFNHYLKGEDNGWTKTPKVRLNILDLGTGGWGGIAKTILHTADAWPIPNTKPLKLFLDTATWRLLATDQPPLGCSRVYRSDTKGLGVFRYKFGSDMNIVGFSTLRLFISGTDSSDLDVFVTIERSAASGGAIAKSSLFSLPLAALPGRMMGSNTDQYFYRGPQGRLRASHRAVDASKSTPLQPVLLHTQEELLQPPGTLAQMDIPLDPTGMVFRRGEELVLTISGYDRRVMSGTGKAKTKNAGIHVLHSGAGRESYLLVNSLDA